MYRCVSRLCKRKRERDRVCVCMLRERKSELYRVGGCVCYVKEEREGQSMCVCLSYVKKERDS